MHCLDSDILIAFLRGDKKAVSFMKKIKRPATTIINAQEVLFGIRGTNKFIERLAIIPYTESELGTVVHVKKSLRNKGTPIGSFDEIIAGICVEHNLSLVTRNHKHFSKVKKLKTITW